MRKVHIFLDMNSTLHQAVERKDMMTQRSREMLSDKLLAEESFQEFFSENVHS